MTENYPPRAPLEQLDSLDGYRRYFTDAGLWQPYVRLVCAKESLTTHPSIRATLPGTCPAFIVDDRWVIKFFGRLFEGGRCYEVEREVSRLLRPSVGFPTPAVITCGSLYEGSAGWPWPYLVYEYVPGISYGEVYEQVAPNDRLRMAQEVGLFARQTHALSLADSTLFPPTWKPYRALLHEQREQCIATQRAWGILPAQLIEQLNAYLLPIEALADWSGRPHLIHADLTGDHILGRLEGDHWTTLAVIDWGDAMVGDLAYELSALHLDLFRGDKQMLGAFLDAYGLDEHSRATLPARALSVALLHRFNVLEGIFERFPQAREIPTLEQLATALWDVSVPDLESEPI